MIRRMILAAFGGVPRSDLEAAEREIASLKETRDCLVRSWRDDHQSWLLQVSAWIKTVNAR